MRIKNLIVYQFDCINGKKKPLTWVQKTNDRGVVEREILLKTVRIHGGGYRTGGIHGMNDYSTYMDNNIAI